MDPYRRSSFGCCLEDRADVEHKFRKQVGTGKERKNYLSHRDINHGVAALCSYGLQCSFYIRHTDFPYSVIMFPIALSQWTPSITRKKHFISFRDIDGRFMSKRECGIRSYLVE